MEFHIVELQREIDRFCGKLLTSTILQSPKRYHTASKTKRREKDFKTYLRPTSLWVQVDTAKIHTVVPSVFIFFILPFNLGKLKQPYHHQGVKKQEHQRCQVPIKLVIEE